MRKLILALTICLFVFSVQAQKYIPVIKTGTLLKYTAYSRALGQGIPLSLAIIKLDTAVSMKWTIEGYGTGTIVIPPQSVKSATKMSLHEPDPDGVTTLKKNETLAILSKDTFNSLTSAKSFVLNGQTFNVVPLTAPFMISSKEADVLYAETPNGKTKLWILNNPDFPLVCKLTGGPQGVDLTLTDLVE